MSDSMPISDLRGAASLNATLANVGDRVAGTIVSVRRAQQTDLDTGSPLTWSDGNPRMMTVVVIRKDDGEEGALYARGGNFEVVTGEGTSLEGAIVDAVTTVGASSIDAGARLEVVHSGLGKRSSAAKNPPKLYRAKYTPAASSMAVSDLFSET